MFDLGIQELIVIFVVALLVFGPDSLPELSRALGRGVRELKIALRGTKESIEEATSQIESDIRGDISPDTGKTKEEKSGSEKSSETKDG